MTIIPTAKPAIYFMAVRPEHVSLTPDEFCQANAVAIKEREHPAGTPLVEGELLTLARLYQGQAHRG